MWEQEVTVGFFLLFFQNIEKKTFIQRKSLKNIWLMETEILNIYLSIL